MPFTGSSRSLRLKISDIRPSQVYISQDKLRSVEYYLRCGAGHMLPPVPVFRWKRRWVLSDGHTRCLGLYLHGREEIEAYVDPEPLDLDMYRVCLQWCQKEELLNIADLEQQVIHHRAFEAFWLQRCRVIHLMLQQGKLEPQA